MKLTIEQLRNYLGTGLKSFTTFDSMALTMEMDHLNMYSFIDGSTESKLMFYRLSDLDKFIPELGFVPLKRMVNGKPEIDDTIEIEFKERKIKSISSFEVTAWIDYESGESRREHLISFYPYGNQGMTPFDFMRKLFQWHFWPFGDEYFEAGLVIDKLKHGN